jgi:hypothetical protein
MRRRMIKMRKQMTTSRIFLMRRRRTISLCWRRSLMRMMRLFGPR